jgi:hypothetical protein
MSVSNVVLLVFIVVVMVGFGLIMSSSISTIALKPLERMLSVVRERCAQMFKFCDELQEGESQDGSQGTADEDYDDMEQSSEFMLLEKVVGKLTAIVNLSTTAGPEVKEEMNENDLMALCWMQNTQVATASVNPRGGKRKVDVDEDMDGGREESPGTDEPGTPPTPKAVPKSLVASMCSQLSDETTEAIETPGLDTLSMSKETQINLAVYLITRSEGSQQWVKDNVKEAHLVKFVETAESQYPANPFHSFAHGVDVTYSVYRFMKLTQETNIFAETSQFWLLVGGVAHDLGHIGVNNQYLVETSHELAVRYNDRSPLENMHCSRLFFIVSDPEANIFAQMNKDAYKQMRQGMINAILHTDITKHNEMIKELGLLYQMNQESFDALNPGAAISQSAQNLQLIMNAFLHGADIENPMKPWEMCHQLAHRCLDEFFAQGDLEKAAGLPVQMLNDRDKVNRPNSQVGFIEFMIYPMVEGMVNCFPQLDDLADNLGKNIQQWVDIWVEETSPPEESAAKVKNRVVKVAARCNALLMEAKGLERVILP